MIRCFFSFWVASSLFAQSSATSALALANGSAVVFPIDPMARGQDLVSMFATLSSAPYKTVSSQIAIQTTRNGLIPNVQSLSSATYSTLMIASYKITSVSLYTVLFVEQVTEMVYSPVTIPPQSTFTSSVNGALPIFSVDLSQRSADIQNIVTTMITSSPYKTATSKVGLQSTLGGPFYLSFTNGFIPDIQSISLKPAANGTLLLVTYKLGFLTSTIVVAPEQIFGIVYSPT